VSLERNDIAAMVVQLSGYSFDGAPVKSAGKDCLLGTLSACCIELYLFQGRIEAGKAVKAQDVSHRLTMIPPTESARTRYVK